MLRSHLGRIQIHGKAAGRYSSFEFPLVKSFRKGDGGAEEGGQPFFKRVSPFPRPFCPSPQAGAAQVFLFFTRTAPCGSDV